MTKNEFVKKIEDGRDIMFDVAGRHYTIVTWLDDGIGIGEQNDQDGNIAVYPDANALVEGFIVGDKHLGDLVDKVVITDYS